MGRCATSDAQRPRSQIVPAADVWPGPVFLSCQGNTSEAENACIRSVRLRSFAANSGQFKPYTPLPDSKELFGTATAISECEQRQHALATAGLPRGAVPVQFKDPRMESSMKNLIVRFVREEAGQDLIEYALIATFVSLAAGLVRACWAPRWGW